MPSRPGISLLVAVAAALSLPTWVIAAGSPSALLGAIVDAGEGQQSVHYTNAYSFRSAKYGVIKVSMVGDAGSSVGIQRITFQEKGRTGHVTVIANPSAAYIRGDAFTMVNYMQFTPAAAAKYAGTWIVLPRSWSGYSTVADGVGLVSQIDDLKPAGPLTSVPETTIDGQEVIGVKGHFGSVPTKNLATLYARAAGSPLPVEELSSTGRVVLSKWNEPVHVAIPKTAVSVVVVDKTP